MKNKLCKNLFCSTFISKQQMTGATYGVVFLSEPTLVSGSTDNILDSQDVIIVNELIGKKFSSISSHFNGVIASCSDGLYVISSSLVVSESSTDYAQVAGGKTFHVGIDSKTKALYSWGIGDSGQLGQGACRTALSEPTQVKYEAKFASVACGDQFCIATDEKGNAYGWGENFDRQLALYNKPLSAMCLKNAVIEDLVFSPRLVPFSMLSPINKVACGPNFAVAVTKNGAVFSWGAGECGQLGTGRCTKQEIPVKVSLTPKDTNSPIVVDVDCGVGHCLVVSDSGVLYRWGLNKSGQLGLNDTATRYEPVTIESDVIFVKVYADGHSSAGIDQAGRLHTWGSNAHSRLMHRVCVPSVINVDPALVPKAPSIAVELVPRLVTDKKLQGCHVHSFAFAATSSVCLVHTTITSVFPTSGPKRSFSQLQIFGYGLWDSPAIVLKFTAVVYSAYNPPRSSAGHLSYIDPPEGSPEGVAKVAVITCKPPKFAEVGEYLVTVSMDGVNFLPQQLALSIYQEVAITSQAPAIVDTRSYAESGEQLKITVKGIDPKQANDSGEFFVKMSFYDVSGQDAKAKKGSYNERGMVSRLQQQMPPVAFEMSTRGKMVLAVDLPGSDAANQSDEVTLLCDAVDLSFLSNGKSPFSASLLEMKCQLSRNNQDYSIVTFGEKSEGGPATSTLFHSFTPEAVRPTCCYVVGNLQRYIAQRVADGTSNSVDGTKEFDREVLVSGRSFVPSSRLPRNALIEAVLEAVPVDAKGVPTEGGVSVCVPAFCESATNLKFTLTLAALTTLASAMSADCRELTLRIAFHLKLNAHSPLFSVTSLSSATITYFLCSESAITARPNVSKRISADGTDNSAAPVDQLITLTRKVGPGYPFPSSNAAVRLHLPVSMGVEPMLLNGSLVTMADMTPSASQDTLLATVPSSSKLLPVAVQSVETTPLVPQYAVQFTLKPLEVYFPGRDDLSSVSVVGVSVALDGGPAPHEDSWSKLYYYSSLAKYTVTPAAPPKGGFTSGTAITLQLTEYCPPFQPGETLPGSEALATCSVRLRGAKETSVVTVNATLSDQGGVSVVAFSVPPEASKLECVMNGKEKSLHVDVSRDSGTTFDRAEAPQLVVK